jgi:hypothetical protein
VPAARARRRDHGGACDPDHDRGDREVLAPARPLSEHSLADEHEHEQAGCERRLHDHERREQQREHLQRPAEHREARAEQPAAAAHEARCERKPQMRARRRLLCVHRLERDAEAVEGRGDDGREDAEGQVEHVAR